MSGVNKVILLGRLGKDPEVRYTQDGAAVANFSIATSEEWKDKKTGEKKEKVEWHRVVAFSRLAEICGEYLHKGKLVYIEGKIRTKSWEKDGVTRYTTEIEVLQMQMLGAKPETNGNAWNQSIPQNQNMGGQYQSSPPVQSDSDGPEPPEYLDEIPF